MTNDPLTAETELALVPGIRTRMGASGHVLIDTPAGPVVDAGPDGFAILAMFAGPRTLGDAIDAVQGRPDQILVASVMMALIETGALLDARTIDVQRGWADPVEHAWMLHDHRRTGTYLQAIRAAVRPGDVVLDIGTGSGILAVAAARAGARRVFAVEASDIASVARDVFEVNGVADRVELIRGWSTQVELPEPADVLVSEIIGTDPLEEEILETTFDARHRLLAPGARMIPASLRLFAQPLAVPRDERWARTLDRAAIDDWRRRYGIALSPLLGARRREAVHWPTEDRVAAEWAPVGEPAELLALDLGSFGSTQVQATTELAIDRSGTVDAVLVTFGARLHGHIQLTHKPRRDERSSWSSSVWFLPDRIEVEPGSRLQVTYSRRVAAELDGLTCEPVPASG
jgi:protein arginine N-methyltransferase 1